METFTDTLNAVRTFFESAKEKINNVGASIATVIDVGKKVADYVNDKRESKKTSTTKKKAKK